MNAQQAERLEALKAAHLVKDGENPYQILRDTNTLARRIWPHMRYARNGPNCEFRLTQNHPVEIIQTNHFCQVITDRVYEERVGEETLPFVDPIDEALAETEEVPLEHLVEAEYEKHNAERFEAGYATEGAYLAANIAQIRLEDVVGTGKDQKVTAIDIKNLLKK